MKRLTILDDDFIVTESTATAAIKEASAIINAAMIKVMSTSINESEELRFCPAYIQLKTDIQPVQSINYIIESVCNAIAAKKRVFKLNDSAVLSESFYRLYNVNTNRLSAIEETTNFFGDLDNISFNLEEGTIEVNDSGLFEARKKLSAIREHASSLLSKLDQSSRNNNLQETTETLQQIVLLKEFIKHL